MIRDFRWWVLGAAVCAVVLAVVFGPLMAGFAFAGVALAFMLVLMGGRAVRFLGDWRREHPDLLRLRKRVH